MPLFKKNSDPLSERSRELKGEIAALEAKIKKLNSQLDQPASSNQLSRGASSLATAIPHEPIFEEIKQNRLKSQLEPLVTAQHYNELGVRKFDLPALLRRWQNQFQAPPVSSPKLVEYLAAGSIQGLRPLRYEKRIARNRFIVLASVLLLILWGLIEVFVRP